MSGENPQVSVPLNDFVREVAREAAREVVGKVISEHKRDCSIGRVEAKSVDNERLIQKIQLRFVALIAFMIGSGTLGGVVGAMIARVTSGA